MNQAIYNQRKLSNMPIISHVKIPSLEVNTQGKEIFKAKKIIVNPPQTKSRSLSAYSNFRNIFKISKNKKDESKENSFQSNNNSSEKFTQEREKNILSSGKKPQNFMEIKYLNEICQHMAKENLFLKNKLDEQEKILKNYSISKNNVLKVIVPKVNLSELKISPLRVPVKTEVKNEELVTFRPEFTPGKKQFRFPREVFSNKLK